MTVLSIGLSAQVADTLEMQEIEVVSTRYRTPVFKQPSYTVTIDSLVLSKLKGQSIGNVLGRYSSIFVRSNAPGAISIASFRGFGGQQTRVLWEGMPINHSMLGVVDLSLLQAGSFTSVEVSPGSSSSAYGSGISGSVALQSLLNTKEISLSQSFGSNGNLITSANGGVSLNKWSIGVGGSYQQNENDYRYFDRNTQQEEHRQHAEFDNIQLQAQAGWKKESTRFYSKFWFLKSDHEIPENVFVGGGTARQYDAAYRWINTFNFRKGNIQHRLKTYLAQTELDYFDPNRGIESISTGREWNNEWSAAIFFSPILMLTNVVSAHFTEVETNNFDEAQYRSVLSGQVMAEWNLAKKLGVFPGIRFDWYNDFGSTLSPSLGVNYQMIPEEFYIHSQLSRNFRAPTFNDLYWPQGGSPDLEPETAIKTEFGIGISDRLFGIGNHDVTFFRADISNGIRWTPGSSTFFEARNYLSLLSYGLEWTASKSMKVGMANASYNHSASYTRATIDETRFAGDAAVNNQLPYVPRWKYSGAITVQKNNLTGSLSGSWVSERYSTEQNNLRNPEPPYVVLDASFGYSKSINKTEFNLSIQVNNVLDKQYEIIRLYPQPLRNFLITITIKQKTKS